VSGRPPAGTWHFIVRTVSYLGAALSKSNACCHVATVLTARWHTVEDIVGDIVGTTLGIVDGTPGMLGTVGIMPGTLGTVAIMPGMPDMPGTLATAGIMPGTLVTDKSSEVAAV
jgi:hypothetical protein